jgi:outer membrane lipoprotein SlyB
MIHTLAIASMHRMTRRFVVSALLMGLLVMGGCASQGGGAASSAGVQAGVIASIRPISLHEDRASEAAARSALSENAPQIAPSHARLRHDTGPGRTLSMVGNAVLNAMAGDNTDDRAPVADGQEVTVRLEGGGTRVVVQPNDSTLKVNQNVRVVSSRGPTRVRSD